MAFVNPYIAKIQWHSHIIEWTKEIASHKWKWNEYFGNDNPLRLEIWTGLWNFFSWEVPLHPDKNFIWMEIKFKRCFVSAEKTLEKWGKNFVVVKEYGQKIEDFIADGELEQTYIFFPDPWGKKERQKKHRIMQKDFLDMLYRKTQSWWKLVFKTDHREYFDDTLELLKTMDNWKQSYISFDYQNESTEFDKSRLTEFEVIFHEKNICYLELIKDEQ